MIIFAMVVSMLLSCGCASQKEGSSDTLEPYKEAGEKLKSGGILTVKGGFLTNNNGEKVLLNGVNFGGWLIEETWMCPVIDGMELHAEFSEKIRLPWAELDTWNMFENCFGREKALEMFESYRDSFITEEDFKNVADLGFNCIRIPFWYRNFMWDDTGDSYYTENDDDNPGFRHLDFAVENAEKYGLYLIFDMHGAPGGQNGDHTCGKAGRSRLFHEEEYQVLTEELWVKIAERYKDCECIAAYDIVNEPFCNSTREYGVKSEYRVKAGSAQANSLTDKFFDRMIKAIRRVDPNHAITVEGIWEVSCLPDPSEMGWENMIYQIHPYDTDTGRLHTLCRDLKRARDEWGVAAFAGEFNPAAFYSGTASIFDEYEISRTVWTYKTVKPGQAPEAWGLYTKSIPVSDITQWISDTPGFSLEDLLKIYSDGTLAGLSEDKIELLYKYLWSQTVVSTSACEFNEELYSMLMPDKSLAYHKSSE